MSKEILKEAATIEEAKALIAAELGVSEDAINFTVVQEPEKKMLGLFGGTTAIVKGSVVAGGNAAAAAEAYLRGVLEAMGVTDLRPGTEILAQLEEKTRTTAPRPLKSLATKRIRFTRDVEKGAMAEVVKEMLS